MILRACLFAVLLLAGVAAHALQDTAPGTLLDARRIAWYPGWYFRLALHFADLPGKIDIRTGATLYRVRYWTRNWDDAAVIASGLVALPHGHPVRGIVSYQHGTSTLRLQAPSTPSLEGKLAAAVFAGGRYLLVAPDYLGLGESTGIHPYLHSGSAATAGRDLLRAAHTFVSGRGLDWPRRVNLLGFSQGGHASAALQRMLEADAIADLQVVCAATASAPFNLADITFPVAMSGGAKSHSVYLAYMVRAYAEIYGARLDSVLEPPFDTAVVTLFDGGHDNDAILQVLPRRPRDMFGADFLAAFDAGEATWLHRALAANQTYDWAPQAPLRLYYGTADRDVASRDSIEAAHAMQRRGGYAEAFDLGPLDHEDAAFAAVPLIRAWFDARNPLPDE